MNATAKYRIYYEDTDAGGVVYYANYLKYLERARTEWLRAAGFDQSILLREHLLAFMVRHISADYRRPAILDDLITVSVRVEKLAGARIIFSQMVSRQGAAGAELLVEATVEIACVNIKTGRPMAIPDWMKDKLSPTA